jgi:hypothetical protein
MTLVLRDGDEYLRLVREHAVDAVAFQGLGRSMRVWLDTSGVEPPSAGVAYFDTGRAWVAAGGPVVRSGSRAAAAARFLEAARHAGRRVVFFGIEELAGLEEWHALQVGVEPSASPADWVATVRQSRGLREQLRRARAKGVRAEVTASTDLTRGLPLRAAVDDLVARWIRSRRIEPMGFVVTADPFTFPDEHRYVVATRGGAVVGLLSAVPAYAGRGWLVEHVLSVHDSPNGTAETLLETFHRSLLVDGRDADRVSLGLSPLSGESTPWQRLARSATRPLFDFEGLHQFKSRLRPTEWRAVWLVSPPGGSRLVALADLLSAFAGGAPLRFAARSLLLHPCGMLWLLAIGFTPWVVLLVGLEATHRSGLAGYTAMSLLLWVAFDSALLGALFRVALRPSLRAIVVLLTVAAADAAFSGLHLAAVGAGSSSGELWLRTATVALPGVGALALVAIAAAWRQPPARAARPTRGPACAQH